jgi:hypothetical protein
MVRNRVAAVANFGIDPQPDPTAGSAMDLFTSEAIADQGVPFADYSHGGLPIGMVPTGVFIEGPMQLAVFGNAFDSMGLQYVGDRPGFASFTNVPLPVAYCSGCSSTSPGPSIPPIPATLPLWESHHFFDQVTLSATYGLGAVGDPRGRSIGAAEVAQFDGTRYQFGPLARPPILPETNDEYGRAVDGITPVMNDQQGVNASVGVGVPSTVIVSGGAVVCVKNPL